MPKARRLKYDSMTGQKWVAGYVSSDEREKSIIKNSQISSHSDLMGKSEALQTSKS